MHAEPNGDLDVRYSLFTERFGKLRPKAKSAKKITSKLAPHLQPGNVVGARLVEKNGLQIVDALKKRRISIPSPDLHALNQLLAEAEPDAMLWTLLSQGEFSWASALALLGWDPQGARCRACGKLPRAFHISTQEFFCEPCASKLSRDALIFIA